MITDRIRVMRQKVADEELQQYRRLLSKSQRKSKDHWLKASGMAISERSHGLLTSLIYCAMIDRAIKVATVPP